MTLATRWKINKPQVVHEVFDDEVVIVNLDNGNYYSLDQAGVDVWNLVESGASGEEIVASISQRYEGDTEAIQAAVIQLLDEFEREELMTASNSVQVQPLTVPEPSGTKPAFGTPALSRFTDMQDLLLLDPIHEVDAAGWPNAKETPAA